MDKRKSVAIHESGHAALYFYEEIEIESISIKANDETLGRIIRKPDLFDGIDWEDQDTYKNKEWLGIRLAKVYLAGYLAEELYLGDYDIQGYESDWEKMHNLLEQFFGSQEEVQAATNFALELTKLHLRQPSTRLFVETVADELLIRETIAGSELHEIYYRPVSERLQGKSSKKVWDPNEK